jgi:hypothetical protein
LFRRAFWGPFRGAIGRRCGLFHRAIGGPLPFRLFRGLATFGLFAATGFVGPLEPRSLLFIGDAHGAAQAPFGHGLRVKTPLPHRF